MGGATTGALEIVRGLQKRSEHESGLCVLGNMVPHPLLRQLEQPIIALGMPVHERRHTTRRWRALRKAIRDFEPDIVHSHLWPAARVASLASFTLPCRLLVHIRDTPPDFTRRSFRARAKHTLFRQILRQADARYISVSQAAKDYAVQFVGLDPNRIEVIMNGIDTSRFDSVRPLEIPAGRTKLILGCAGRLVRAKGHSTLIEAIRIVREQGADVQLKIAGSGGLTPDLRSLVAANGLEEAITFLGPVNNMPSFYEGIDVFVLPSLDSEGLPRVVMEAISCGRPFISTSAAGVEELVPYGLAGQIVRPGDASMLAEAIHKMATNRQELVNMGRFARETVSRQVDCHRVVNGVADCYARLLNISG